MSDPNVWWQSDLRQIEELAAQILNPDVVARESIRAQLYHPSPLVWTVGVHYTGCSRIEGTYRTTKCRGKQPDKAIRAMKMMLSRIIEVRKNEQEGQQP